jgi:hypothetical protein
VNLSGFAVMGPQAERIVAELHIEVVILPEKNKGIVLDRKIMYLPSIHDAMIQLQLLYMER